MKQLFNLNVSNSNFYEMVYGPLDLYACEFNQLRPGDYVVFSEINSEGNKTGYYFNAMVKCILNTDNLKQGSCVFSFVVRYDAAAVVPPRQKLRS